MLIKSHISSLQSLIKQNYTNLIIFLVFSLSCFSFLGLGMKNYSLSYFFIISFLLFFSLNIQFKKNIANLLCLLTILGFISSVFIKQTPYGFYEFMTIVVGLLTTLLFINNSQQVPLQKIFNTLSVLNIPVSIFSVIYFFISGIDRSSGLFLSNDVYVAYPNAYASMLLFILVAQFYYFYQKNYKPTSFTAFYYSGFFINLVSFWLTFSRGAYLSLFIGLSVVFLTQAYICHKSTSLKTFIKKSLVLLLIGLTTILSSLFINHYANYPIEVVNRLSSSNVSSEQSANERYGFWSKSLSILQETTIFGTGPGSFEFIHPKFQNELLTNAPHPHNFILKVLLENGIQTSIFLILLLCLALYKLIKSKNILLLSLFITANTHLLIDYNLNFPVNSFLFFMILGLSLSNNQAFKKPVLLLNHVYHIMILTISITAIFQIYGFYHIKLLENSSDLSHPSTIIKSAALSPFPSQLYSLQNIYVPTDKYPNFHPAIYNQALNTEDPVLQIELHQRALNLNYYNDISYHYSFLNELLEQDYIDVILQREADYKALTADYIGKLKVNAHNTIATPNPKYMLDLINLFLQLQDKSDQTFWTEAKQEFISVYQVEKIKFETRFNIKLPSYEF